MYGLAIKRELEDYYGTEVNHGRLYPNLDELVDLGLVCLLYTSLRDVYKRQLEGRHGRRPRRRDPRHRRKQLLELVVRDSLVSSLEDQFDRFLDHFLLVVRWPGVPDEVVRAKLRELVTRQ
ncbi:PadR family transcriptional regulator [Natrinema limicola JCM 13563]|uniref:PadR family transcriptional regulator n=1 Tax=Natrinema limicola JCM 13563 TaxID=1230457 RepID=M0CEZ0_9EURY|nr:PadR family transcriptional regulator [Natrinema limicola JCM 13563]